MPLDAPVRTRWWHTKEDDETKVVCTLCPRECHIPSGSRGFCFVRANVDGELVLTTYGRSSGFCIDPIEKKPLNHFLPGTPVLSFGTAGCNLGCKFCQNWDISKSRQMDRVAAEATPQAIIDAAQRSGCRSVAFTYNDPVIWAEYAIDIAKVARQRGIKTVAVTAGYITPEARGEFYEWIDAANIDLKAFTETFYRKLTQTHLEPVLDTLKYLKHETEVWFEITNLMIPGENDSPEETERMCGWIVDNLGDGVPVHFTAFHPDFKMLDTPRTPHETLCRAREQALEAGIRYAYVGNVNDVERQSTYCANCKTLLIERDWYELGVYRLQDNRCVQCGANIPGVFENGHGNWGRKRLPIRIEDTTERMESASATMAAIRNKKPARPEADGATAAESVTTGTDADVAADASGQVKTRFTAEESNELIAYVRAVVDQAVRGEPVDDTLRPALRDAPAYGAFVTLKRASMLRACRGRWAGALGESDPGMFQLGPLLQTVAGDTAMSDTRFAAIHTRELGALALDISIMFDAGPVTARGTERVGAIEVGRHGLVISHPKGRGLLLPQVATENGWDAATFLNQLCRKAGLEPHTWQADEAELMTFCATVLEQEAPEAELDSRTLGPAAFQALLTVVNAVLHDRSPNTTPDDTLTRSRNQELGVHLQSSGGLTAVALSAGKSLLGLTRMAAGSLKEVCARRNRTSETVAYLTLLWRPIRLRAQDYPQRHRSLVNHAVLAEDGCGEWALVLPRPDGRADKVDEALRSVKLSVQQWNETDARLTAFSAHRVEAPRDRAGPGAVEARTAARAGQFYPAKVSAMTDALERHLAADPADESAKPTACRAVMLPHAGWLYCGDTIGRTIRRVAVPGTVIVVGPKHTPHGAAWSIPPHKQWDVPGGGIPIATNIAEQLLKAIPTFECDTEAHRGEHGTEVLLPFLRHMNPELRVLPLVLGGPDEIDRLERLGDALAEICSAAPEPVLLVISSDMNHFATEAENRRLDHLALDAMLTGDARRLYEVVTQNKISMCGFRPAVAVMLALSRLGNEQPLQLVDYTNSAAVTGDTSSVVGYAGVLLP